MKIKSLLSAFILVCICLVLCSCTTSAAFRKTTPPGLKKSPPAYAPAHGKRRKQKDAPVEVAVETTIDIDYH